MYAIVITSSDVDDGGMNVNVVGPIDSREDAIGAMLGLYARMHKLNVKDMPLIQAELLTMEWPQIGWADGPESIHLSLTPLTDPKWDR